MFTRNRAQSPAVQEDTGAPQDQRVHWTGAELEGETGKRRPRRALIALVILLLLLAGAFALSRIFGGNGAPVYEFATVRRGDISKTISATGKLQALTTVQVGSQVSGRISEIHADFNDRVRNGDIVARIDPSLFQAQLDQARANLNNAQAGVRTAESAVGSARANVAAAEANRERMKVAQADAERQYRRMSELGQYGAVARRDVETADVTRSQNVAQARQSTAEVDQARAQLQSAQAQLAQARAQVTQAQAAVDLAQVNLDHTIIRAPIDGVVVARNIDVGQTVAASFQAPTLFLIANDLTQMQVLADIDEADVGQLGPESEVTFTVDAFPRDTFSGRISQIRLNPVTEQNVVTYTAVIDVPNPDLKLRPGMTANVTALVAKAENVLTIPNTALRFRPPGNDRDGAVLPKTGSQVAREQTVWKRAGDGSIERASVQIGITDGIYSEVRSGDIQENDQVAVGQAAAGRKPNPMMPFGGGRGGRR